MKMLKVSFELVSPVEHREYYCRHGEHPATDPATIPDEHWKYVERVGNDVYDQYRGLCTQVADGELIRNVKLWEAEVHWVELTPASASVLAQLPQNCLPGDQS